MKDGYITGISPPALIQMMNLTGYDLAVSATAAYSNKDEKFDKHFLQSWSIQF